MGNTLIFLDNFSKATTLLLRELQESMDFYTASLDFKVIEVQKVILSFQDIHSKTIKPWKSKFRIQHSLGGGQMPIDFQVTIFDFHVGCFFYRSTRPINFKLGIPNNLCTGQNLIDIWVAILDLNVIAVKNAMGYFQILKVMLIIGRSDGLWGHARMFHAL